MASFQRRQIETVLRLFTDDDGNSESMVQRVYRQILKSCGNVQMLVTTSESQVDSIHVQLGENVDVITEQEHRDTFPVIALAAAYLCSRCNCSLDEAVIVVLIDPYTGTLMLDGHTRNVGQGDVA